MNQRPPQNRPPQRFSKNILLWIALLIAFFIIWNLIGSSSTTKKEIDFTQFFAEVEANKVAEIIITGDQVKGKYTDGTTFKTVIIADYDKLTDVLREYRVKTTVKSTNRNWASSLFTFFPFLLLIFFWLFFMKRMTGGANQVMSFGKSKAKLFAGDKEKITFKDVAGIDEAKEELQEIIEFLKNPQKFQKLGGKIPKGVIIVGPPGCGKTLLAKAVAGEADVPFLSISGSDFVEMFVGVGASRVRDLFEQGNKYAPCLIFIDELDAVGRQRGAGLGGGHDEREQTLNQLLVEMDGFDVHKGIIVLAATNRPDILDMALLRAGRFDRQVMVNMPDVKGREEILKVHIRKIPLAEDIKLEIIARSTHSFTGADLANLVNEAALIAARRGRDKVIMEDIEYAKDKVLMGMERKSMVISEKEKKNTAYHEAGHALVAATIEEADPIHKVTIIPRGLALGATQQLPLEDRHTYSKNYLEAQLTVLLAGRQAEELILKQITTGAANDFERATEIARRMVCQWGMSDVLGSQSFENKADEVFIGRDFVKRKEHSEKTAQKIDEEIKKILDKAKNKAKEILEKNTEKLEKLAQELLKKETLNGEEIKQLLNIKLKTAE